MCIDLFMIPHDLIIKKKIQLTSSDIIGRESLTSLQSKHFIKQLKNIIFILNPNFINLNF